LYAIYYNVTNNEKRHVTASSGEVVTLDSAVAGAAADDNVILTNVNCDEKIDITSFDSVGNATNGSRKDWKVNLNITDYIQVDRLLNDLLFEFQLSMFKGLKYKIVALDIPASISETFENPLYDTRPLVDWSLSDLQGLKSSYVLNFDYDSALRSYKRSITVDKNGVSFEKDYSSGDLSELITDYEVSLCKYVEDFYGIKSTWEYNSKYISDRKTAELFLQKIIRKSTDRFLQVNYIGGIKEHIKYEVGDIVKINVTDILPAGYETKAFIIEGTDLRIRKGNPYINFQLTELK
jgi:hypothetical protein